MYDPNSLTAEVLHKFREAVDGVCFLTNCHAIEFSFAHEKACTFDRKFLRKAIIGEYQRIINSDFMKLEMLNSSYAGYVCFRMVKTFAFI